MPMVSLIPDWPRRNTLL